MSELSVKMNKDMILHGFSENTRKSYIGSIRRLALYYQRSPDKISSREVEDYLLHLLKDKKLTYSTCNCLVSALKFLYEKTLEQSKTPFIVPITKQPLTLPVVPSRKDIEKLFSVADNVKHRLILMLAYGSGLRISEIASLKITNIDSEQMCIKVEQGKGHKDRFVLLSPQLLIELRQYWKVYRPISWLFPGKNANSPVKPLTIHRVWKKIKEKSGLRKHFGLHSLRHAFATHMLENGIDLYTIKQLLGHSSIRTTVRYLRLTKQQMAKTLSPLDLLKLPKT
tara:strand:+ start:513 stop:1358 length:846 start_codon:yes stop_codon:yes gene_type:complete